MNLNDLYNDLSNNKDDKKFLDLHKTISKLVNRMIESRINLGLTQRDLEKISGVKQSAIARFEKMQVIPKIDTILNLMYCLNIDIQLICNSNEQNAIATISGASKDNYKNIEFNILFVEGDYNQCHYNTGNFTNIYFDQESVEIS